MGSVRVQIDPAPVQADDAVLTRFNDGAASPAAIEVQDAIVAQLADAEFSPAAALDEYLAANPGFADAIAQMDIRAPTHQLQGYGTDNFWKNRVYDGKGQKIVGKDAAIDYFFGRSQETRMDRGRLFPSTDKVRTLGDHCIGSASFW